MSFFKVLSLALFGFFFTLPLFAGSQLSAPDILEKICRSDLGGMGATIEVLRDVDGGIAFYKLEPDRTRFSHPPVIYYNAEGKEELVIPNKPIDPKSAEAQKIRGQQESLLKRFTLATGKQEIISCSQGVKKNHGLLKKSPWFLRSRPHFTGVLAPEIPPA